MSCKLNNQLKNSLKYDEYVGQCEKKIIYIYKYIYREREKGKEYVFQMNSVEKNIIYVHYILRKATLAAQLLNRLCVRQKVLGSIPNAVDREVVVSKRIYNVS